MHECWLLFSRGRGEDSGEYRWLGVRTPLVPGSPGKVSTQLGTFPCLLSWTVRSGVEAGWFSLPICSSLCKKKEREGGWRERKEGKEKEGGGTFKYDFYSFGFDQHPWETGHPLSLGKHREPISERRLKVCYTACDLHGRWMGLHSLHRQRAKSQNATSIPAMVWDSCTRGGNEWQKATEMFLAP